mgnify:CR=1 FL=1
MNTIITNWIDITNKLSYNTQYKSNKDIASALDKHLLGINVHSKVIDKITIIGEIIQVNYIKLDDTVKIKILFYQTTSKEIIALSNSNILPENILLNL